MSRRLLLLGFVVVAGGVAIAWLSAPSAVAQFGGELGGGDFGGLIQPPPSFAGEQIIQGGSFDADHPSFFILTSPDKIQAWGYSTAKGEWKKAPLDDRPETTFVPIVGSLVAAIAEGRKVHAFSSLKGEWNTLELPEGTLTGDQQPVVGIDYVQVGTPASVSIFSARTGNWSTVKFTEK